ncbi:MULTISPECIES: eCIS core domain-containing protein [unclassified Streptomyces]|uniref:eCIS core domain-containing protein n=1 Tax=unclassified Streptomyces TaxID=2593676 RepID=UPI0040418F89
MTDQAGLRPTLGWRLDAEGRRLAAALSPVLPWAGPLREFLDRTTARTEAFDGRFDRVELPLDDIGLRAQVAREAARADAASGLANHRTRTDRGTATLDGGGLTADHPGPSAPGSPQAAAPAADGRTAAVRGRPGTPPGGDDVTGAGAGGETGGRPLPADVRARLRDATDDSADTLRVHDDDAADAVAARHRAEAVTVGRDVYFRRGRFLPRDDAGFALLAHEATHVLALLRPGAAWHRATGPGAAEEESEALIRESAALTFRTASAAGPGTAPPSAGLPTPHLGPRAWHPAPLATPLPTSCPATPTGSEAATGVPSAPQAPEQRPMRAAQGRETGPPPAPPPDIETLRRELLHDLMRQLRTEFERGG